MTEQPATALPQPTKVSSPDNEQEDQVEFAYVRSKICKPVDSNIITFNQVHSNEKAESEYDESYKWRGWQLNGKCQKREVTKKREDYLHSNIFETEGHSSSPGSEYKDHYKWFGKEKQSKYGEVVKKALKTPTEHKEEYKKAVQAEKKERDSASQQRKKENTGSVLFPPDPEAKTGNSLYQDEFTALDVVHSNQEEIKKRKKEQQDSTLFPVEDSSHTPRTEYQKAYNVKPEKKASPSKAIIKTVDIYEQLVQDRIEAAKNKSPEAYKKASQGTSRASAKIKKANSVNRGSKKASSLNGDNRTKEKKIDPGFYNNPSRVPVNEREQLIGPVWVYWPKGKPLPSAYKNLANVIH